MRCIECGGTVLLENNYSPLLINHGVKSFTPVAFEQRNRTCTVCGLVHNFDVKEIVRHTFTDIITVLKQQEWFGELGYEDKGFVLGELRYIWNANYQSLNRLTSSIELLKILLTFMGLCEKVVVR